MAGRKSNKSKKKMLPLIGANGRVVALVPATQSGSGVPVAALGAAAMALARKYAKPAAIGCLKGAAAGVMGGKGFKVAGSGFKVAGSGKN